MIDTKSLTDGDICLVNFKQNGRRYLTVYMNGTFQNVEDGLHTSEVYGSSVYSFKRIQNVTTLIPILDSKLRLMKK